jgi:hypothetical protein
MAIITGSRSDDWIYWYFFTITLNYNQYSVIADLHAFQLPVAHAVGFSVSTNRLLATNFKTETITSNHYEVFLPFPAAAHSEYSTKFSSDWTLHGNSTTSSPI